MPTQLHKDEVPIDEACVKHLLESQFPHWATLPLERITPEGTDNVMFYLGDDKVIRLPRMVSSGKCLEREINILPQLQSHLPIPIPSIIESGTPSNNYPFPWVICSRLPGSNPSKTNPLNLQQAAEYLGHFVVALQAIHPADGPACHRSHPLASHDTITQQAIDSLGHSFDRKRLLHIWKQALTQSEDDQALVWAHGDLHAGNLLAEQGNISAVIDFGCSGLGDPAVDCMVAWTLFTPESREIFKATVKPDNATWERGRAWALNMGALAYPYYEQSNPGFAAIAKRTLDAILLEAN